MKKRIGIVGSRDFFDYKLMKKIIDRYKGKISIIVSGGASGADILAINYAKENNIKWKVHSADWNKYGRAAGFIRNELIVKDSDGIIAFWDQKSRGTANTLDLAKKYKKLTLIIPF